VSTGIPDVTGTAVLPRRRNAGLDRRKRASTIAMSLKHAAHTLRAGSLPRVRGAVRRMED